MKEKSLKEHLVKLNSAKPFAPESFNSLAILREHLEELQVKLLHCSCWSYVPGVIELDLVLKVKTGIFYLIEKKTILISQI